MPNSKIWLARATLILALSIVESSRATAMPDFLQDFLAQYPFTVGTKIGDCPVCHVTVPRPRNQYGIDYNLAGRRFPAIESIDSDDDGFDNLTEIMALTFPGDPNDLPGASPTDPPTPTPTATATPTSTPSPTPTLLPGPCYGDCNGDGRVTVDELVRSMEVALNAAGDECMLADGNGQITVDQLVLAVYRALHGCPPP